MCRGKRGSFHHRHSHHCCSPKRPVKCCCHDDKYHSHNHHKSHNECRKGSKKHDKTKRIQELESKLSYLIEEISSVKDEINNLES